MNTQNTVKKFFKRKLLNRYFWSSLWYKSVVCLFFPKNKWARAAIPRTFRDVDGIYEDVLFNGLVFFWEEDDGEQSMRRQWDRKLDEYDSQERIEESRLVYETLKKAYDWAKVRQEKYESAYCDFEKEEEYAEIDTVHLSNIIKYRQYMWT